MNVMTGSSLLLNSAGYQISRSVRLRSSASAYFNRTLTTPTDAKKWTWSGWVKRGILGASPNLFWAWSGSGNEDQLMFSTDTLRFYVNGGVTGNIITNAVFRDPSAWYHIIAVYDSANATSNDRMILYVNGVRQTLSTNTQPTLNYSNQFNTAVSHSLGRNVPAATYFDGYLTEVNFIDGQALTPASFGQTNPTTGVWEPIKYNGTYGTNGFYLNFSDNSASTATTIGKDYSGNGNNWTPNNISVTAGVTYDSMLDVPTQWADGGNGRGNYCVINPLATGADATISNANLSVAYGTSATISTTLGTMGMSSGQWYWENTITATSLAAVTAYIGMVNQSNPTGAGAYPGATSRGWSYYGNLGNIYNNGSTIQTSVGTFAVNDVIGVAYDADAGTLRFFKNNTQVGTTITGIPADTYYPAWSDGSVANTFTIAANFGQRPFSYTPPSGFKALNTLNLPTPTILKGNQYMNVLTWSGTGGSAGATRSLTGLGFQPDFVWEKNRASAQDHHLFDSVRGAGTNKTLASNSTGAEGGFNDTLYGYLSSFDADGFTTTNGSSTWDNWNKSGDSYVAWSWKEGATQGFDIVTYTGTGSNTTVAHNLGVAPNFIILKCRSNATNWFVGGSNIAAAGNGTWSSVMEGLNTTSAVNTGATAVFNSTAPTSSVFSLGTELNANGSGRTFVAYLFAAIAGYSAFGRYTGNGSADGPFVFCGFRPRWIMFKRTDAISDWMIVDTARSTINVMTAALYADLSQQEDSGASVDVTANGFKLRSAATPANATNGSTHIFAAFAENPFKNALAR